MHTPFLRLLPAALVPVLAVGCVPVATWLPDSSGFVYTGGGNKDKLYLYDLDKKAARTLVEKGAGPAWPAVSPDGKRIAVALSDVKDEAVFLEVIVFDRDGKEVHRSEKIKWAQKADHTNPFLMIPNPMAWVPDQDKLLLRIDGETAFYDLKTKNAVKLDVAPCTIRCTPIRPDGKGFLAFPKDPKKLGLLFVDWESKQHEIQPTPKDTLDKLSATSGTLAVGGMLAYPHMHSSHWDGPTAVVSWDDLRLRIDTDKLAATGEQITPALSEDKKVIQDQVQLTGGTVIRAAELAKRYQKDQQPLDELISGSYRVEVIKQGAKEPKTLMEGARCFLIEPSPDGKKAVVVCSKTLSVEFFSPVHEDMLYLIDGDGDVADTIDLAK